MLKLFYCNLKNLRHFYQTLKPVLYLYNEFTISCPCYCIFFSETDLERKPLKKAVPSRFYCRRTRYEARSINRRLLLDDSTNTYTNSGVKQDVIMFDSEFQIGSCEEITYTEETV